MKQTVLFAAAAALLLFGACQKDGKYNPKEKIAKVYEEVSNSYSYNDGEGWQTETNGTPKHVTEQWTWDGKKLAQIVYPSYDYDDEGNMVLDGDQDVLRFTYDGSQLTEVKANYEFRMVFTYDGKKLQKAEIYDEKTTPDFVYEFEHDGKKISTITMTGDGDIYKKKSASVSRMEKLLLGNIIPQSKTTEKVMRELHAKAAKSTQSIKMNLTWDGDNVSKITAVTPYGNATMSFTYDDKNNPFKGFGLMFGGYGESEIGVEFCNKNNITKIVLSDLDGDTEEESYTYTYDGKWPVSRSQESSYSSTNEQYSWKVTEYFEYE